MSTKLSVFNQALLELKQRKLATLADAGTPRRTLDDFWDSVVEYMLNEGLWNFAIRAVAIEHSTEEEPSFGFTYAVAVPDDFVRLNSISANGDFWPTLDRYHFEQGHWHVNVDPLYVRYVSNDTSYGADLGLWTPAFERAVVLELAHRVAPHLTGMSEDKLGALEKKARRYLSNARTKDAINQAAERPPPGRLVTARQSGSRIGRHNRGVWDD